MLQIYRYLDMCAHAHEHACTEHAQPMKTGTETALGPRPTFRAFIWHESRTGCPWQDKERQKRRGIVQHQGQPSLD